MSTNKRISLSLLSEYLTAGPSRRKSIIEDAADGKPFISTTYNQATSAISSDIIDSSKGLSTVSQAISKLKARLLEPLPDWKKQHVRLCIEALQKYQVIRPTLNLETATILPANIAPRHIMIGGIRVNVSPEAILRRQVGNAFRVGVIKFYFSKSKPLGKDRAEYTGAIMHWYCEQRLVKQGLADHKCSLLVDLPGNLVRIAPKGIKLKRQNIEAACAEIGAMWPS